MKWTLECAPKTIWHIANFCYGISLDIDLKLIIQKIISLAEIDRNHAAIQIIEDSSTIRDGLLNNLSVHGVWSAF